MKSSKPAQLIVQDGRPRIESIRDGRVIIVGLQPGDRLLVHRGLTLSVPEERYKKLALWSTKVGKGYEVPLLTIIDVPDSDLSHNGQV